VLLVNHGYPPQFNGGSEIYTQTLGIGLVRAGCAVAVFAREHDAFRPDFTVRRAADETEPALRLHLVNYAREAPYARFLCAPIDAAFTDLLDSFRPDVVHFGHLNHLSLNLPALARARGARTVYTLHDFWLACPRGQFVVNGPSKLCEDDGDAVGSHTDVAGQQPRLKAEAKDSDTTPASPPPQRYSEPYQPCDKQENAKCASDCYVGRFSTGSADSAQELSELAYWTGWVGQRQAAVAAAVNSIDAFISPSVHLRARMVRDLGLHPGRCALLPYGLDRRRLSGRRRALTQKGEPFVFGFTGRHQPTKGIQLLLRAAALLVERRPSLAAQFRVVVFGRPDPATLGALRRIERESPLAAHPGLIEWQPEYQNAEIVPAVLDQVDALVVPSLWAENAPLVILEAQQAGVPVIAADAPGPAELIGHAVNGLLFKQGDAAELARQMHEALMQPVGMAQLGRRGFMHARDGQAPSIERHVDDVTALYKRLIKGQGAIGPEDQPLCD
jgi:glycosyltransferase involved in cell wall biosynthesis